MRCVKANRACGGYRDRALSSFRLYEAQGASFDVPFISTARKCTLPVLIPIPGTSLVPVDNIPTEISQSQSNELALRAFFYDYCIIPSNTNLSRGFLSGLEKTAIRLGPDSDLAKACQAVGFGAHGKTLQRAQLIHKAERFYQDLLSSFAEAIKRPRSANATESKLIAMLLGLFQVLPPILGSVCNAQQS